jgi:hypothetical protein
MYSYNAAVDAWGERTAFLIAFLKARSIVVEAIVEHV